jgi:uncharacterized protein (DUF2267 family)
MTYKEIIHKVQENSGFSLAESKDSIEMMVESLAVHLAENERKDFADQLPEELHAIAMSVYATNENSREGVLEQFARVQNISVTRAKKQINAAWRALKAAISKSQIARIRAQLPNKTTELLQ